MESPKHRILCTEDDCDTLDLLEIMLKDEGYDLTCTQNAEQALQLLQIEKFDLCLIDNWLPGTSGEELCRKIREFDHTTPILFYSAAAYESDKKRARKAGAQGYLVKPVTADQLLRAVARLIAEAEIAAPFTVVPSGELEPIRSN